MTITKLTKQIKCDTVLCDGFAMYKLCTKSYKGDSYLCEKCFNELKNIFKRIHNKNEEK